jgi:hypothetical protein
MMGLNPTRPVSTPLRLAIASGSWSGVAAAVHPPLVAMGLATPLGGVGEVVAVLDGEVVGGGWVDEVHGALSGCHVVRDVSVGL